MKLTARVLSDVVAASHPLYSVVVLRVLSCGISGPGVMCGGPWVAVVLVRKGPLQIAQFEFASEGVFARVACGRSSFIYVIDGWSSGEVHVRSTFVWFTYCCIGS